MPAFRSGFPLRCFVSSDRVKNLPCRGRVPSQYRVKGMRASTSVVKYVFAAGQVNLACLLQVRVIFFAITGTNDDSASCIYACKLGNCLVPIGAQRRILDGCISQLLGSLPIEPLIECHSEGNMLFGNEAWIEISPLEL